MKLEKNLKWQHQPRWNGAFSWVNTGFLVLIPLLTLGLAIPYWQQGPAWVDLAIFLFMIFTTGFGITAGYHRLFAHQSYDGPAWVKFFLLFFGAGAWENSAYKWCSDHRYHHRFVDKEGDPYNINRGFFYAHMGWIFYSDPAERSFDNAADLKADRLVYWQHRYYLPLAIFVSFVLPTLLGLMVGRPFAGFFIGGLVRLMIVHHGTFLINSAAHVVGTRPYSTKNSARDCWWLALFTNGEGYHNFHHAFANDYRNGLRWYQWDPTKWMIYGLYQIGAAWNLHRTPDAQVLRARLESSWDQLRPEGEMPAQLEKMRASLEERLQEFQLKLREFQAWKESFREESARTRRVQARYWRRRLHTERRYLERSIHDFRFALRHWQAAQCFAI